MNPETTYPKIGENVYLQREVNQVYIFAEKTGESKTGNITAGRILELSDGTRSIKEIGTILMKEFLESPSEEEILGLVCSFLSECEEKGFIEFRSASVEEVRHEDLQEFTSTDVEKLFEENAVIIIDEKASFDPTEDGNLTTYSLKEGTYLMLSKEEKDILVEFLEEKPLQEILSDISENHGAQARQMLIEFICELLNHGLVKVQRINEE